LTSGLLHVEATDLSAGKAYFTSTNAGKPPGIPQVFSTSRIRPTTSRSAVRAIGTIPGVEM
jgi:hypothetical protein